ncbi:MAG: peptidoglycan DD-metalloendopeptidase family protein [Chitinivibrionales bacterium]|nr:peptidoglycan DD-metalloendopeptidase family protein [Chitinivibrionales bacterium]
MQMLFAILQKRKCSKSNHRFVPAAFFAVFAAGLLTCSRWNISGKDAAMSSPASDSIESIPLSSQRKMAGMQGIESLNRKIAAAPWPAFPVAGKNRHDISSHFGAARDSGKRYHLGIDIPAPHGAPVVAVVDGLVYKWDSSPFGGKELFLYDTLTECRFYYAHLSTRLVKAGQRVGRGDTLGRVGSTGNARNNPHLHFSVYTTKFINPVSLYPGIHAADFSVKTDSLSMTSYD